jgi:hypothetical protein
MRPETYVEKEETQGRDDDAHKTGDGRRRDLDGHRHRGHTNDDEGDCQQPWPEPSIDPLFCDDLPSRAGHGTAWF